VCFSCVEPGIGAHEGQVRSPMTEYPGPTVPYARREVEPAIRQPYPGQMRPSKPGSQSSTIIFIITIVL